MIHQIAPDLTIQNGHYSGAHSKMKGVAKRIKVKVKEKGKEVGTLKQLLELGKIPTILRIGKVKANANAIITTITHFH